MRVKVSLKVRFGVRLRLRVSLVLTCPSRFPSHPAEIRSMMEAAANPSIKGDQEKLRCIDAQALQLHLS